MFFSPFCISGAVHVTLTDQAQLLPLLERNVAGAVVSALAHQQQLVTAAAAAVLANSAAAEAAAAVIVAETECLSRQGQLVFLADSLCSYRRDDNHIGLREMATSCSASENS
jgi:hypothetical protein